MANIAAHAIAAHAAVKSGAAGEAATHGTSGIDAIFAALLAEGGQDGEAALASAQASVPGSATNTVKLLAQALKGRTQPSAKSAEGETATPADASAPRAAAAKRLTNLLNGTAPFAAPSAKDGDAAPDATDITKTKDKKKKNTATDLSPVAGLQIPQNISVPAPSAAASAGERISTSAGTAMPSAPSATPGATLGQTASQPRGAQLHDAFAPTLTDGQQPTDETMQGTKQAVHAAASPSQAPAHGQPQANAKDLSHALAALQASASKSADTKAVAAQTASAAATKKPDEASAPNQGTSLAAALMKAKQQDVPPQRTVAMVISGARPEIASSRDGASSDPSDAGENGNGSHPHHAPAEPVQTKPTTPAPILSATPQSHVQAAHIAVTGSVANDPTAAAQSAATALGPATAPAISHVAASLQVAPQTSAQGQPVPLSDLGAIAIHIAAQSSDGAKHFSIALHPQDLGGIHVQLSVDHSGTAQAHLSAETQQTLHLLQRDSHQLERALKDAGLNLSNGGLNFSLKGQQQQNSGGRAARGHSRSLSISAVASAGSTAETATQNYSLTPGSVRLDIRV